MSLYIITLEKGEKAMGETPMGITPMYDLAGRNCNDGWGGDGSWFWIVIILLFAGGGGLWGNNRNQDDE